MRIRINNKTYIVKFNHFNVIRSSENFCDDYIKNNFKKFKGRIPYGNYKLFNPTPLVNKIVESDRNQKYSSLIKYAKRLSKKNITRQTVCVIYENALEPENIVGIGYSTTSVGKQGDRFSRKTGRTNSMEMALSFIKYNQNNTLKETIKDLSKLNTFLRLMKKLFKDKQTQPKNKSTNKSILINSIWNEYFKTTKK